MTSHPGFGGITTVFKTFADNTDHSNGQYSGLGRHSERRSYTKFKGKETTPEKYINN